MKQLIFFFTFFFTLAGAHAQKQQQYTNPILSGFYPDPSICRVGDDYYLVNSTFSYFPGIPVFHSKDLVNWKLIGHVITREEQMDFTGKGVSRSLFAPTIRFHDGLFYLTCTMIDGGGNFVVTAKNPAGPWSNPTWLPIDGIDPSLYFDDDGKSYITYNSIPPDNKSLYSGHRTIRINEFDYKSGKVLGENKILVNGGTDISKKPSWIEGPHIVKKYGYYYLISAEGGTGPDHSVVAFRSKNIFGPYEPYEKNPILTQRNLSKERKHPVTSAGHADFVELPDGRWYTVFLATRPYKEDYFNTGRETFLAPVVWEAEWPLVNPGHEEVQYHYPLPLPAKTKKQSNYYSGNFSYRDDFSSKTLSGDWIFLRTLKEPWYSLSKKKGFLSLQLRPQTVAGRMNPSYIGRRQQHTNFTAATAVSFQAKTENEKAGLLCFIHEDHYYFLAVAEEGNQPVVQLFQSPKSKADSNSMVLLASSKVFNKRNLVYLKVDGSGEQYRFFYSTNNISWNELKAVDSKFLSTKEAGGFGGNFVGVTIGPYATSMGKQSSNTAMYDWFQYVGNDEVFRN